MSMADFFELYDILIDGVDSDAVITNTLCRDLWTAVETDHHFGMAMTTPVDTLPRMFPGDPSGRSLKELAVAAKSWNLTEAGFGMAAINAFYNTPERLDALGAWEPFDNYCTEGLDLKGRTIGVVGHLNMPQSIRQQARELFILERDPRPGDYPDAACDLLLPKCDIVIITASTLVNKTLPHLLDLCRNAYTILAGPSCPMCPELLTLGIDRLAGLVVTDRALMRQKIDRNIPGTPYPMGLPFLLKRENHE